MKKKVLGLILLVVGMSLAAQAVVKDYNGKAGAAAALSGATNYVGGVAPVNDLTTDIVRFNLTSYAGLYQATNAGYSLNGVIFGDGTTTTADAQLMINGAAGQQLTLGSGGIVVNANAGNATINKVKLGANQVWTNNSVNTLSIGTVTNANVAAFTATLAGSGAKIITGSIGDGGTTGTTGLKIAGGTTTLSAANWFTGGLTLDSGTLKLGNNGSLGGAANVVTINGGTLDVTASRTIANNNAINLNGDFNFAGTAALNTGSGAVTLGGNRIVTVDASTMTVGGVIGDGANTYSLTKAGAGTLTLTNANTYKGGTVLNNGTLNVSHIDALGKGALTINGGTVAGNGSQATNNIIINGDFAVSGNTGTTVAQFHSNTVSLGTAAGTSRTITASAANAGSGQFFLGGVISDGTTANKIVKKGAGGMSLGGANVFTGGVDLDEGTLFVNNNSALGTGMLSISNGTTLSTPGVTSRTLGNQVSVNGDFTLGATAKAALTLTGDMNLNGGSRKITVGTTNGAVISGNIKNGIDLTVSGETITLSGTNTYSGDTKVMGTASLYVSKDVNLGAGANVTIGQNSKLIATAGFTTSKNIIMTNAGNTVSVTGAGNKLVLNGNLLNGGSADQMQVAGSGMLVLNSANNTFGSSYVLVNGGGSIGMGNSNALNGANLKFNGGRGIDNLSGAAMKANGLLGLSLTSGFTFDGTDDLDLSGAQARFVQTANSIRTMTVSAKTLTLSGVLASGTDGTGTPGVDGGLIKSGIGTLILNGPSDYTNVTTVTAGKLVVNGSMASKQVTVNTGGTLGGTGAFQAVTINAGGILAAGNSPGTMTFDGALILSSGSTNIMEIASESLYDVLDGNGNNLTLNGETVFDFTLFSGVTNGTTFALNNLFANWNVVDTNGASYSAIGLGAQQDISINGGILTVIPEPATIGMLGLGAIITIMLRRMRTR